MVDLSPSPWLLLPAAGECGLQNLREPTQTGGMASACGSRGGGEPLPGGPCGCPEGQGYASVEGPHLEGETEALGAVFVSLREEPEPVATVKGNVKGYASEEMRQNVSLAVSGTGSLRSTVSFRQGCVFLLCPQPALCCDISFYLTSGESYRETLGNYLPGHAPLLKLDKPLNVQPCPTLQAIPF